MAVTHTPPACTLPSNDGPGCGCKPAKSSSTAKAAVVAAGTAAACTACCVLPFTLPTIVVANIGGALTLLDHAHGWVTWLRSPRSPPPGSGSAARAYAPACDRVVRPLR